MKVVWESSDIFDGLHITCPRTKMIGWVVHNRHAPTNWDMTDTNGFRYKLCASTAGMVEHLNRFNIVPVITRYNI